MQKNQEGLPGTQENIAQKERSGFKCALFLLLAVLLDASYLTSLNCSFLICQMGLVLANLGVPLGVKRRKVTGA